MVLPVTLLSHARARARTHIQHVYEAPLSACATARDSPLLTPTAHPSAPTRNNPHNTSFTVCSTNSPAFPILPIRNNPLYCKHTRPFPCSIPGACPPSSPEIEKPSEGGRLTGDRAPVGWCASPARGPAPRRPRRPRCRSCGRRGSKRGVKRVNNLPSSHKAPPRCGYCGCIEAQPRAGTGRRCQVCDNIPAGSRE